ncbi:hypothetical protein [Heliomicrobium gestii]|uniref:hypothetical protein n=1 Tax=Heliomicrobium gestii TaxID=2699 RepID=UPI00195D6215|nr:hypothetical protein [Heliomicrobium gestii]MBM7868220.1 hypothetical protein [Heliomicrobium gestii]
MRVIWTPHYPVQRKVRCLLLWLRLFERNGTAYQDKHQFEKHQILKALQGVIEGDLRLLDETAISDSEIKSQWNRMIEQFNTQRRNRLFEWNAILQDVTNIDSIRDMVARVRQHEKAMQANADLHRFARGAATAYQKRNMAASKGILSEMERCSAAVVSALDELKNR